MLSFYDWYADLPPSITTNLGEQTDVQNRVIGITQDTLLCGGRMYL